MGPALVLVLVGIALTLPSAAEPTLEEITSQAKQGNAWAQGSLGYAFVEGKWNGASLEKDYDQAANWFGAAADQGSAYAYRWLSFMATNGMGLEKDLKSARQFLHRAAELGDADAQYDLGTQLNGELPNFDALDYDSKFATAVGWLEKSANLKNVRAALKLGEIYGTGPGGVGRDLKLSTQWYGKAAFNNSAMGQVSLGYRYEAGHGIDQNLDLAQYWYHKAADQGEETAIENLFALHLRRFDDGESEHSFEVLKALSEKWPRAKALLAYHHISGRADVPQDIELGKQMLQQGVDSSDPEATFVLARYFLSRRLGEYDSKRGLTLLGSVADQGHVGARELLAEYYIYGYSGLAQDGKRALELLQTSGYRSPNAVGLEGLVYLMGRPGIEKDEPKGIELLKLAASSNNARGNRVLASAYLSGRGVTKNYALADDYYERAIKLDDVHAMNAFAWFLATTSQDEYRDGTRAVGFMESALKLRPDYSPYVDTLAAAYAEAGDYEKAVFHQRRAISLLEEGFDATQYEAHLASFEEGKPWRQD